MLLSLWGFRRGQIDLFIFYSSSERSTYGCKLVVKTHSIVSPQQYWLFSYFVISVSYTMRSVHKFTWGQSWPRYNHVKVSTKCFFPQVRKARQPFRDVAPGEEVQTVAIYVKPCFAFIIDFFNIVKSTGDKIIRITSIALYLAHCCTIFLGHLGIKI